MCGVRRQALRNCGEPGGGFETELRPGPCVPDARLRGADLACGCRGRAPEPFPPQGHEGAADPRISRRRGRVSDKIGVVSTRPISGLRKRLLGPPQENCDAMFQVDVAVR